MRTSILAVSFLLGCGGAEPGPDATRCAGVPYAAGMAVTGDAGARVTLVALTPSPPARFTNAWTVTVTDPADAAIAAPADVTVTTFMPAHGHAGPAVSVTAGAADALEVAPLELWMPGTWQVDFAVATDAVTDLVRFEVCVEE